MKPNRRLALKRESLTELSAEDMVAAVGASAMGQTCDVLACATVTRMGTVCYACNLFSNKVC